MKYIVNIPCIDYRQVQNTGLVISDWLKSEHNLIYDQDFRWYPSGFFLHETPAVKLSLLDSKWATLVTLKFLNGIES
jgi:hypothetical protein